VMCANLVVLMFVVETRAYGFGAWLLVSDLKLVEIVCWDWNGRWWFSPIATSAFADVQIFYVFTFSSIQVSNRSSHPRQHLLPCWYNSDIGWMNQQMFIFRAGLSPSVFKLPASQSTHDLILRLCT
jgi:hypothetical protein